MTRSESVFVPASPPLVACLLFLVGSASLSALQGCRQLEEGTASGDKSTQHDSGHTQLHGCWKLNLQADGPQRDSIRALMGSLPSIVELDTARAETTDRDDIYKAHSWFDGRRESRPFSIWRRMDTDSIRVQRAGALAGTMLELHPEAGKLVGNVVAFSDAGMRGESGRRTAALSATSVQCPDP